MGGPTFTPLAGAIGADVRDVDLSQPLEAAAVEAIREGLLRYLVLFFREQKILSPEQHKAAASHFGEMEPTPFRRPGADAMLLLIDQVEGKGSEAANFHADNTFRPRPPLGALLQAHIVPERGGDTCFASMYAAYEALSPAMQRFLEGLEAHHSLAHMAAKLEGTGAQLAFDLEEWPPVKHPVIAVHPETGRKLLNVNNNWTTRIDGLGREENAAMLKFLFAHIMRPEFQVRLRWNPGDVAFWDNRSSQHYAVPDYQGRRLMQRVSLLQPASYAAISPATRAA